MASEPALALSSWGQARGVTCHASSLPLTHQPWGAQQLATRPLYPARAPRGVAPFAEALASRSSRREPEGISPLGRSATSLGLPDSCLGTRRQEAEQVGRVWRRLLLPGSPRATHRTDRRLRQRCSQPGAFRLATPGTLAEGGRVFETARAACPQSPSMKPQPWMPHLKKGTLAVEGQER